MTLRSVDGWQKSSWFLENQNVNNKNRTERNKGNYAVISVKFHLMRSSVRTVEKCGIAMERKKLQVTYSNSLYWRKATQCKLFCSHLFEVFVNNTNLTSLTFLYKISNWGILKKIKLPPVGLQLSTLTITGLQVWCLSNGAKQTCVEWDIFKLNFVLCTTSLFGLWSFLDSI